MANPMRPELVRRMMDSPRRALRPGPVQQSAHAPSGDLAAHLFGDHYANLIRGLRAA